MNPSQATPHAARTSGAPLCIWRGRGVSDTGDSLRGRGRGAAENTTNDEPTDSRCKRVDVHSTMGYRGADIPGDASVRKGSRI
jgi:hypothetical protein